MAFSASGAGWRGRSGAVVNRASGDCRTIGVMRERAALVAFDDRGVLVKGRDLQGFTSSRIMLGNIAHQPRLDLLQPGHAGTGGE